MRWATPSIRSPRPRTSSSEIIGPAGSRTSRRRRAASATRAGRARANAATTSSTSSTSQARDDQPLRDALEPRGDLEQQRPDEVGERPSAPTGRRPAQVAARDLDARRRWPRAAAHRGVRPTRPRRRTPRPAPSRASRRRSRARRAAAPVGQRAGRLELGEQLQRQPRGRVRAGAERLAGLDDDVERARARLGSHGGRTRAPARPSTSSGRCQSRQRSSQPSGSSVVETSTSASPAAARRSPQRGQLARARRRSRTRRCRRPASRSSRPPGASSISSASTSSGLVARRRGRPAGSRRHQQARGPPVLLEPARLAQPARAQAAATAPASPVSTPESEQPLGRPLDARRERGQQRARRGWRRRSAPTAPPRP